MLNTCTCKCIYVHVHSFISNCNMYMYCIPIILQIVEIMVKSKSFTIPACLSVANGPAVITRANIPTAVPLPLLLLRVSR